MHLLAKKPEDRPASARAVVEALRAIEEAEAKTTPLPAPARPKKSAAPAIQVPPGRPLWHWAAVAAGVLAVVLVAIVIMLNRGGDPAPQQQVAQKDQRPQQAQKDKQSQKPGGIKAPPMLPCAADALRREDVPADKRAWAGSGNAANAPPELVAVLPDPYMTGAISPDGKTLALGTREGDVKLRDVATGEELTCAARHAAPVLAVRFSSDGKRLATSGAGDGAVNLWDVASAKKERTVASLGFNNFPRIAFSPDSKTLAVGSFQSGGQQGGNKLELYPVTGAAPVTLADNTAAAVLLVFSPTGHRLVTAPPAKVWDTARGKLARPLEVVGDPSSLDVSPDGKTLACTYSADPDVALWDVDTGAAGRRLHGEGHMSQAVFSPDATKVAAVSAAGIHVWDVATGKQEKMIKMAVPGLGRGQMLFSPEGRHLITFNPDGVVCVFRLQVAGKGDQGKKKFVTTMSGLQYIDQKMGTGPAAKAGDMVEIHYIGWLKDGNKFDSSLDRGLPLSFKLGTGMVIKGWDEGVAGMKAGGKRKLIIPPELGYVQGRRRRGGGLIPANAELTFEVELLRIRKE
jgi:FKBP-type peptidyl-prolyl cis-trans isomerase FkpA